MQNREELNQRIEACRELYLKYDGGQHERIEREMREMGFHDFYRRKLYRRYERGHCKPGWIETYGWNSLLKELQKSQPAELKIDQEYQPQINADDADKNKNIISSSALSASSAVKSPLPSTSASDFEEFKKWLKAVSPGMTWDWKHQVYIYKYLERVTKGLCKRLMLFLPPRHGKSELVTVRYAAWRLKQDPSMNVIISSHTQKLANNFSRKIKRVLCDDHALSLPVELNGDKQPQPQINTDNADKNQNNISSSASSASSAVKSLQPSTNTADSPFPFTRTRLKNTEAEWETTMGGGLRAVGVGSGVTGFGANLIIVDDPVKSREQAESKTFRDKIWNWFNDDLYTRLEPDGAIILIQTRWHEDDLAGRLLRESQQEGGEQWEVVDLPALAETIMSNNNQQYQPQINTDDADIDQKNIISLSASSASSAVKPTQQTTHIVDELGRIAGEALCPQRFNEQKLDELKRKLGTYSFAALYQQRPSPAEGGMFKRAWFKIINSAPPNLRWKRGYDLGISTNEGSDYTASLRVAYDNDSNIYIDGAFRKRIEYPDQRRYILGRIESERDTDHGIELSANGHAVIQDLRREKQTRGWSLRGVRVKGDKITRALPWIALAEEGKVFLIKNHWNQEFLDEAASFPSGTHDDQIDAVSIAIQMHREQSGKLYRFNYAGELIQ